MSRTDGLDEILGPWMARNARSAPDALVLRVMTEVDTMEQRTLHRPWLLTAGPLAALGATVVVAALAVAIGLFVSGYSRTPGTVPVDAASAAVEARVDKLVGLLNNGPMEEYVALYATNSVTYGNVADDRVVGVGRASVEQGWTQFKNADTSMVRDGPATAQGPFVTFHFTWKNGLGYEGTGVTTLTYDDAGLILYDATFLDW